MIKKKKLPGQFWHNPERHSSILVIDVSPRGDVRYHYSSDSTGDAGSGMYIDPKDLADLWESWGWKLLCEGE